MYLNVVSFVALSYHLPGTILCRAAATSRQAAPRYLGAHLSLSLSVAGGEGRARRGSTEFKVKEGNNWSA